MSTVRENIGMIMQQQSQMQHSAVGYKHCPLKTGTFLYFLIVPLNKILCTPVSGRKMYLAGGKINPLVLWVIVIILALPPPCCPCQQIAKCMYYEKR